MKYLETEHLILRSWKEEDREPYFHINQDPKVIECLLGPLTEQQVDLFIEAMNKQQHDRNYTLWAVEEKATGGMMGFIGLNYVEWEAPFTPAVEIGWRLGSEYWGKGYATEGAKAVLEYGFEQLGLQEIVSFTVPANKRSQRVMEKIGMMREEKGDFCHPKLMADHPLSRHILCRLKRQDYGIAG